MSDYLRHLAARTLRATPVARPRLTSMFGDEQTPRLDSLPGSLIAEAFEVDAESSAPRGRVAPQRSNRRDAPDERSLPAPEVREVEIPEVLNLADVERGKAPIIDTLSIPVRSVQLTDQPPLRDAGSTLDTHPGTRSRALPIAMERPSEHGGETSQFDAVQHTVAADRTVKRPLRDRTTVETAPTTSHRPTERDNTGERAVDQQSTFPVRVSRTEVESDKSQTSNHVRVVADVVARSETVALDSTSERPSSSSQEKATDEGRRNASPIAAITAPAEGGRQGLRSGVPQQQRSAASPSTINVTIGRVEVRAVPPPPAAGRSQRVAPATTSLDQYLLQRNKGKGT